MNIKKTEQLLAEKEPQIQELHRALDTEQIPAYRREYEQLQLVQQELQRQLGVRILLLSLWCYLASKICRRRNPPTAY